MKFPKFISGPTFGKGDLTSFSLDEAHFDLRVLHLPFEENQTNRIAAKDELKKWLTTECDEEFNSFDIAVQDWTYLEDLNHFEVAHIFFEASILEHSKEEIENHHSLNSDSYMEYGLNDAKLSRPDDLSDPRPYYPTHENSFLFKPIIREHLNGYQYSYFLVRPSEYPSCVAFFSLGQRYSLRLSLSLSSLHYEDIKNPYSEETLQKMKEDLFEDLLANIHIEYKPEFIALIKQHQTK